MQMTLFGFVLATLAVWRVTHLLVEEDGPGRVFARLRAAVTPDGFWASLLGCFYCLSLWVALPFAWGLSDDWGQRIIVWLALSGAACLLERLGHKPAPPALFYEGNKEESHHELLRRSAPGDRPPGGA